MNNILNKIIILIGSLSILLYNYQNENVILPIVITVAISGFLEYFNSEILNRYLFFMYCILCCLFPQFTFLLPLIGYDLFRTRQEKLTLLMLIPLALHFKTFSATENIVLILIISIGYFMKIKAIQLIKLKDDYINQRDYLTELSFNLENSINELVQKQDAEVNLATLNERNRIAREIHDNVGHLLSSSILQIGAIIAITKETNTKASLEVVKNTLNTGMNSIRCSVHNLHNNSIDLFSELNSLVNEFAFCNASLKYEITGVIPANAKYAIIAIVKEALANVIKHSNCDDVFISLFEHPKLFQLIIYDNGTKKAPIHNNNGMGLESIKKRVASIDGIVNFDNSKGFKIFISFKKD